MRPDGAAPVVVRRLTPPTDRRAQMIEDVRHGLTAYRKYLPSVYFYDAKGSELFEKITTLPEYYLTRAETEILEAHADEIMELVRPVELVELGSGSSTKTRLLLGAMRKVGGRRYVPIDVSEEALRAAAQELCTDYPWLEVEALIGDYVTDLDKVPRRGRRLIAFLGSTIGNYVPTLRLAVLRSVASALVPGEDAFLVGVDLVKDEATMVAAYDDEQGVSAEFNKNILHVVNRELDADIPVDAFEHVTRFDPEYSCMVQSLRATRDVVANVKALDLAVSFREGEEIHTEVSCKFTRAGLEAEFAETGLRLVRWYTDAEERFAVAIARHA